MQLWGLHGGLCLFRWTTATMNVSGFCFEIHFSSRIIEIVPIRIEIIHESRSLYDILSSIPLLSLHFIIRYHLG